MARLDAARRRLVLAGAELGMLVALAAGVETELLGTVEGAATLAALRGAGVLGARDAGGWVADLARAVARPDVRLDLERHLDERPTVQARIWRTDRAAVAGVERADGEVVLAWERPELVLLLAARAAGLVARPPADPALGQQAVRDARIGAWRARSSISDDVLTVVDAGERGLWTAAVDAPSGPGRLAPATLGQIESRLATLLGVAVRAEPDS